MDTSCQRLFSFVPENGRLCVFGTHTKKANSDLIVPWEQKLLPGDKTGDPRLLLVLLRALQSQCGWEAQSECLSVKLTNPWITFSWSLQMGGAWQIGKRPQV